jgi:WD40 repeat protein
MKHHGPISGIACHGNYIATAGYDNQVVLWNGEDKQPIARGCHDHLANQVCFAPDGAILASASSDYSVRLWDVPTMRLRAVLAGHEDDVEMVAFAPDGRRLATCSRDRLVRVFDLEGSPLATMRGHTNDVVSVAWSADGRHVLSSSDDGSVRRWDAQSGAQLEVLEFDGVQTDALVVTSQGRIVAGDDNGRLMVIDGDDRRVIAAHAAGVKRIILSEQFGRLASLSYDRSLVIWNLDKDLGLTEWRRTTFPTMVWPRSGVFLDSRRIATGTFGSSYAIYDIERDAWELDHIAPYRSFNAVAWFAGSLYCIGDAGILFKDGAAASHLGSLCNFLTGSRKRLLTGGQAGRIFDAISGELLHQHHSPINCGAVFYKDGHECVAFGTYTGEIVVLDLSGAQPAHVITRRIHDNAIKGIAADSHQLFSVSASAEAVFTAISDFNVIRKIGAAHQKIANGCVAIKGGFASVSRDLHLRLWRDGRPSSIRTPHRNSIKCVSSDAGGEIIACGSYGGAIHLYDVRRECWIHGVRPTSAGISSLTFVPEQRAFVASSYDGALYRVPIESAARDAANASELRESVEAM